MPRSSSAVAAQPVVIELTMTGAKRASVRFDAPAPAEGEPRPAINTLYLANAEYESLGSPVGLKVTIEAA